jgi:hypothetical protein
MVITVVFRVDELEDIRALINVHFVARRDWQRYLPITAHLLSSSIVW